jgi:hypothetical protein
MVMELFRRRRFMIRFITATRRVKVVITRNAIISIKKTDFAFYFPPDKNATQMVS